MPARPARAMTCTMALVEPPMAMLAVMALSNEAAVRISLGFKSCQAISTMRRPTDVAMRECSESTAGIDDAPGRVMPSVSAMAPMVEAVPMVMQ